MEFFVNLVLPAILYLLAIALMVILIIIGLRIIKFMDKCDKIADDVEEKINSVNGAVAVVKKLSDGLDSITDSFLYNTSSLISRVFRKNKKYYKEEDIDE